ncbi:MAG: hypothetical protein NT154_18040 [Verrucomicrobia bacterium]|nr:hypothetical protein [Verrucomicrobiota bacterium]
MACVNGPGGGRVVAGAFEKLPFDLIQEWGFVRTPFQELGKVNDEPIVHAVADASKSLVVGATKGHLFTVDIEVGKINIVGEVPGGGRIALGSKGGIFGQDGPAHIWRYDVESNKLERKSVALPEGTWGKAHGTLYTADANGTLFSLDEERGFSGSLGRTLLAPVGPMAVTHDGRVFGFCGPDMAKMFCYNPTTRAVSNLGVAVSVLERRRYGYVFGDAVTGRDGQIIFGEDDDLGHLWLYFPRIQTLS